ncbi:MAG: YdiU family protein [Planctomycetes bacterium]|nr:YdiU family protein [Planctomycetota bacterium]
MLAPSLAALPLEQRYARLPAPLWTRERVTPLDAPWLVGWSDDAARALGLDPAAKDDPATLEAFNGQRALAVEPVAMAYAGHQFGVWVPRLGDGRAVLLGEARTPGGETWDVQVKGSGRTAFSRVFDGRSVLRSAVRELLASEALDALGIPTTRALCVVGSRTPVRREEEETGALLVRLAPTHVRLGTFEWVARSHPEHLAALADHVIAEDLAGVVDPTAADRHRRLLDEVVHRTARLVAAWQAHGFVHGVLNTDNLSIVGVTLDYGPFAFVEAFDPGLVVNHSDPGGRYAFDRQPEVCLWNLGRLAVALAPLVPREAAEEALAAYGPEFGRAYRELMRKKLGLAGWRGDEDDDLLLALLQTMSEGQADLALTLRALGRVDPADASSDAPVRAAFRDPRPWAGVAARYAARLRQDGLDPAARRAAMDAVNPRYVLRTHLAQRAIERAQAGDGDEVARLLRVLRRPFDEQPGEEAYALPPPADAPPVALSCSS